MAAVGILHGYVKVLDDEPKITDAVNSCLRSLSRQIVTQTGGEVGPGGAWNRDGISVIGMNALGDGLRDVLDPVKAR